MYSSLINSFEKERGFVSFAIESFNKFLSHDIQDIIKEIGSVNLSPEISDMKLSFGNIELGKPVVKEADGSTRQIFPNEARIRNLTYLTPLHVDIIPIFEGVKEKPENVHIIDMPIMVKSMLIIAETKSLSLPPITIASLI